jgi:hypothetical protein
MWSGLLLAAALLGGGMMAAMALVGPENFDPPMPGLDTETGIRSILGILGYTAFVPAAVGTLAVTSEYRHRTAAAPPPSRSCSPPAAGRYSPPNSPPTASPDWPTG